MFMSKKFKLLTLGLAAAYPLESLPAADRRMQRTTTRKILKSALSSW
jgi:hypothetical protein